MLRGIHLRVQRVVEVRLQVSPRGTSNKSPGELDELDPGLLDGPQFVRPIEPLTPDLHEPIVPPASSTEPGATLRGERLTPGQAAGRQGIP